ncbi:10011_t:CDS:2 [Paraglomus brasilianum]|uniref:10011_t:CDS:1 n=1 Tax=Paraglomus brasilianum TaxID=144538 RepID=A0A9N9EWK2_9GLOM|nr:10011_t:CDS:2 [Paraglomus brasilianum]
MSEISAVLTKTADRLVFVKFTMRYGLQQAHVNVAEKGFAPALLGFDELDRAVNGVFTRQLEDADRC